MGMQQSANMCSDFTDHLQSRVGDIFVQIGPQWPQSWLISLYSLVSTDEHPWCALHPTVQSDPAASLW